MKRVGAFALAAALLFGLLLSLGIAAVFADSKVTPCPDGTHTVDYSKWVSDEIYHWNACSVCGAKDRRAKHAYSTDLSKSAEGHWRTCVVCGATEKPSEHVYKNSCGTSCIFCGFDRGEQPHVFIETKWEQSAEGHWHVCDVCGKDDVLQAHTYSNACDPDCNVCGFVRTPSDHKYAKKWLSDAASHWKKCSVCGALSTPADHVYDNACDPDCNVCGAVRTPSDHVYSKIYSADAGNHWFACEICGAKTEPVQHVYHNVCDANCSVCGYTRVPAAHQYSGWALDETGEKHCRACTVCGAVNEIAPHVYDGCLDPSCNVCGYIRADVGHTFSKDWSKSETEHWHAAICGHTKESSDRARHTWDEGTVTQEASLIATGTKLFTCTVCGAERTEELPILPSEGCVVFYDANGGTDAPEGQTGPKGSQFTITSAVPTRIGFRFLGWSRKQLAASPDFLPGEVYQGDQDLKLYAVWQSTDPKESFVIRMYRVCLGREATAADMEYYIWRMTAQNATGVEIAKEFIFSAEFKVKNYCDRHYTVALYEAFMGRQPTEEEAANWVWRLQQGDSREAVFNEFALSPEFGNICKESKITQGEAIPIPEKKTRQDGYCSVDGCTASESIVEFVRRMYTVCLDRNPGRAEIDAWHWYIVRGDHTGSSTAQYFLFNEEFLSKGFDSTEFVRHIYSAMMGREPGKDEKDYWIWELDMNGSTREQVFSRFVSSDEFRVICGRYGVVHS